MKTHLMLTCTVIVLGISLTSSFAHDVSEYLYFTRHRDSNGNLLAGPTHHQSQPSVIQKTVVPAQPKSIERRTTDWGMNVQEVKINEPVQPIWELRSPILENYEQRVAYRTQIEGIATSLTYTFYEDKLAQANYLFEPKHDEGAEYIQNFHSIKDWITHSYGTPSSVQEIWLDPLYRYDKSLWGQAVMRGHLKMVAEWRNDSTQITLLLDGEDDSIGLMADFDSVAIVSPAPMEASVIEQNTAIDVSPIGETPVIEEHPVGKSSMEDPSVIETPTEAGSPELQPGLAL